MRKKLLQLSALLSLGFSSAMAETRIMVISDVHTLIQEHVGALDSLGDNKLTKYSGEILNKATANIIEAKPDLLLVCGDMTLYGEKSGHIMAHDILKKVTEAGIPVKIIPGNHDILCPLSLDNDKANVTPEEFADLYKDMGYGDGISRDPNSLSWAASINDKLAVIGLDANIYDGKEYYGDGCLRLSTINWMKEQAAKFQAEGKMVIASVHEEIMNHFTREVTVMGFTLDVDQQTIVPKAILNINHKHNPTITEGDDATDVPLEDVQKAFADAGIHYVLTGHFHVHNTAMTTVTRTDGEKFDLYDLSTGGLTTYPNWIRTVIVDEENKTLNSTSTMLEMAIENDDLQKQSKEAVSITDGTYSQYGFTVSGIIEEFMAEEPYELYDKTEVYQNNSYTFPSLKYTRIFEDKKWQTLYVPFESTYSDWSENFEIALPSQSKDGAIYFNSIKETSAKIAANTLVLVRLKDDKTIGRYSIDASQPSVVKPEKSELALTDYTLTGTYSEMAAKDHYVSNGKSFSVVKDSSVIKPMRWYIDNTGSSNNENITIYIDNKEVSVKDISFVPNVDPKIYRINGTQVFDKENLSKGIYVINGKKTIVK